MQAEATNTQLQDLQNQNSLLKKAVAIQHARLGKHAGEKETQIQQMQDMLSQYQSRIHSLESSNYALSLHLKQATSNGDVFGDRPPDVC
jgi:division protein CdvB (Snf7/Vps24/ESCRT-III family)